MAAVKVNPLITDCRPRALQPIAAGWEPMRPAAPPWEGLMDRAVFRRRDVLVFSTVENVEGDGPSWHMSVSLTPSVVDAHGIGKPRRATEDAIARVFRDFGLIGFDEDNHAGPDAVVRNYWLQVAPDKRAICPCKDNETPVVQAFGDAGGDGGGEYVHRDDKEGAL